jgi:hypothetical protein
LGTLPGEPGAHPAAVQETDGSAQPGEYADKLAHEEPTAQHAANYRKNALFGVVGHFALMILGSGLQVYSAYQGAAGVPVSGIAASLSSFAMLGALCLGIWGCCCYAMYKGYHAALGLLGFLSCIGVLVLWILPNKRETFDTARKWSTALIVGAALIVILLVCAVAAVVPYVLSSRRAACDTEARSNLEQLNAAVQKLAAEAADMGVMWDQSALERLAREDGLKQLVGSHYGWSGGSTQCECVFRMQKHGAAWRIESAAGGGSRPGGAENRVIHGIDAFSGKAVRPTTGPVSASAQGAAQDWSAYPVQGSCYTESMVQAADSSRAFKIKSLKPVPCGDVSKDQGASAKSK